MWDVDRCGKNVKEEGRSKKKNAPNIFISTISKKTL